MSKVRVETLTLSYKATAMSPRAGRSTSRRAIRRFVVTSPNGESRTYTLEMTEFTETLTGTYTISNLWVYGGTGAAYDCTKLYKPADKSWCWNGEGRGPAAEMDNYLVFTLGEILADGNTTGTCMNWAGEDAKNWDCVFAGASNPDTGKAGGPDAVLPSDSQGRKHLAAQLFRRDDHLHRCRREQDLLHARAEGHLPDAQCAADSADARIRGLQIQPERHGGLEQHLQRLRGLRRHR